MSVAGELFLQKSNSYGSSGDLPEARCSYVDHLSDNKISFYLKMLMAENLSLDFDGRDPLIGYKCVFTERITA